VQPEKEITPGYIRKIASNKLSLFIIILITTNVILDAQNVDLYLSLIEEGKIAEVRSNLPELELKFPNDPGVQYLKALIQLNGDDAIDMYHEIVDKYPNSKYADDSAMKIAEYLYSRGLYSQASKYFQTIPLKYSGTNNLDRSIQLMVNSYLATGEDDSAKHYLRLFAEKYPDINIHKYGVSGLDENDKPALVKVDKETASKKIARAKENRPRTKVVVASSTDNAKPWVVQVGAFSNYSNAKNLKLKLGEAGYAVILGEITSGGRRLYVVRVARYSSRDEALRVGQELNNRFGLDFRILNSPEK